MEAALIAGTVASPFTIVLHCVFPRSGVLFPSTNTLSGLITSPSTARFIASNDACNMFSLSISAWVASPIAQSAAHWRICSANAILLFSDKTFESTSPVIGLRGSKITAAAMTLPTRGPLPASSTPAVCMFFVTDYITNRSTT